MKAPVLESQRLLHEPLSLKHISQEYVNWLNDQSVSKYIISGRNYTPAKLEEYLSVVETQQKLFWAIHVKETHKHIGNIKIDPVNEIHGLGEYGIMMGDKTEWGKGYAYEASRTIIDYCFNTLNLRKMTLGVVEANTAAVALYTKLGFRTEGIYKAHELHDGVYLDTLRMALFNPDHKIHS